MSLYAVFIINKEQGSIGSTFTLSETRVHVQKAEKGKHIYSFIFSVAVLIYYLKCIIYIVYLLLYLALLFIYLLFYLVLLFVYLPQVSRACRHQWHNRCSAHPHTCPLHCDQMIEIVIFFFFTIVIKVVMNIKLHVSPHTCQ